MLSVNKIMFTSIIIKMCDLKSALNELNFDKSIVICPISILELLRICLEGLEGMTDIWNDQKLIVK